MTVQPFSAMASLACARLTCVALVLAACAGPTPEPQAVAAVPRVVEAQVRTPVPAKPRLRRTEAGCRVDLTPDRKAALFRQFAAEQAGGAGEANALPPPPPRPDPCRQAGR